MTKGFPKPDSTFQRPFPINDGWHAAHDELFAKRNLTLVMRSNVYPSAVFKEGDMVQVSIHYGKIKRRYWTSLQKPLSIEQTTCTITVPGLARKTIIAAVEDARAGRSETDLGCSMQESIDQLDFSHFLKHCLMIQTTACPTPKLMLRLSHPRTFQDEIIYLPLVIVLQTLTTLKSIYFSE